MEKSKKTKIRKKNKKNTIRTKKQMEPSPWMGPQKTCPESRTLQFSLTKKQKQKKQNKNKKTTNGTQPLDGPPRKHVRNSKITIFLHKKKMGSPRKHVRNPKIAIFPTKKQKPKKNKITNGTQSMDGPPRKHVRNPKIAIFPHKKNKISKKHKIKTNRLACFLGDPSRDSVPFVFFVLIVFFLFFFLIFVFFDFSIWAYFGFVFLICFFYFSSNRGRYGRVTVVKS